MLKNIVDKIADRIRIGYLAAFLLLLLSYILTFSSTQKLIQHANSVNHTNRVIYNLDNIIAAVNRCESDFRGYLLTNKPSLFSDYQISRQNADSTLVTVQKLTSDNPYQKIILTRVGSQMNVTFQKMANGFSAGDSQPGRADSVDSNIEDVIQNMTALEESIHKSQREEQRLLSLRSGNVRQYTNAIKIINVISIIIAIFLTVYSVITFNRENKARLLADQQTLDFRNQLEQRFDELASVNMELIELRNIEKFSVTGRISRTIAHEVRNPLTNINLAVEHLRADLDSDEETNMLFEMITRNSERINQLISNLLNSTRTSELKFKKANINEVLDKSLEFAQDRIELKRVKVIKNYDPGICLIRVDEEKIHIAFLNIIVNAIEAMEDNGKLYLSTESIKDRCVVKIRDNGKGMNKSDVDKLFEPYFTTKENGHGLGLTNTQNIILGHNANISAESAPGKGTTFTITFNFA
ncbi:MAG: ATP-binding protein [Ginsengibacter sp.]